MSDSNSTDVWSYDFRHVLSEELKRFDLNQGDGKKAPASAGTSGTNQTPTNDTSEDNAIKRAHEKQLVGLAFSGGGIRSATFNLGILQSLARLGLLQKFDYLSTVSGGGYIGSWLLAWMKRRGVKDVRARLRPERKFQAGCVEPSEIHFLRRFSNYLTPKLGWLGADMWTVIAVYIRNLILNLIILASAFALIFLSPHLLALLARHRPGWASFQTGAILALLALFFAIFAIVRNMRRFGFGSERNRVGTTTRLFMKKNWFDRDGVPVDLTEPDAPLAWYGKEKGFNDFVLELLFKITDRAHAQIRVWGRIDEAESKAQPLGGTVHISCGGQVAQSTGTINGYAPEPDADIQPAWNKLEITCLDDVCTVRVNDRTVNQARVPRPSEARRRWQRRNSWLPGAIAIDKGGVQIGRIKVREIKSPWASGATQGQIQRRVVIPLFVAAFLATLLFGFGDYNACLADTNSGVVPLRQWLVFSPINKIWSWQKCGLAAGAVSAGFLFGARMLWVIGRRQRVFREVVNLIPGVIGIFFAAGVGGILALRLYDFFVGKTFWSVLVWGTPAIAVAFLGTIVLFIGLLGRILPDERREWWSRLSAWLLIYTFAWIAIFGLACYGPALIAMAAYYVPVSLSLISASWLFSTVSGLIAARSEASGKQKSNRFVEILAKTAPYIFIIGFLLAISFGVDALLTGPGRSGAPNISSPRDFILNQWSAMYQVDPHRLAWVTVILGSIVGIFSVCLDINQFSMHLLYRNRLGRCYLGASNRLRRAQPFTGFSPSDDLPLSRLAKLPFHGEHAAPYPIINAALNLVGGKELAWQQRKAASFVFTPLFCGYEFPELPPGYCDTRQFASKATLSRKPNPVTLATAMAISGAAASPNMGYHTSPAPGFSHDSL